MCSETFEAYPDAGVSGGVNYAFPMTGCNVQPGDLVTLRCEGASTLVKNPTGAPEFSVAVNKYLAVSGSENFRCADAGDLCNFPP